MRHRRSAAADPLTPKVMTWWGGLFLLVVGGAVFGVFGREVGLGTLAGMVIGVANFKAIALILRRVLGPSTRQKVLYAVFGLLKFSILVAVLFGVVYYQLFDAYGILAGFTAVLLLVLVEGMIRAGRSAGDAFSEEKGHA